MRGYVSGALDFIQSLPFTIIFRHLLEGNFFLLSTLSTLDTENTGLFQDIVLDTFSCSLLPYLFFLSTFQSLNLSTTTYQTFQPSSHPSTNTSTMSTSNPLTYLPSRRTAVQVLLYPLLLLLKFVVILWGNELPGRHRKAVEKAPENKEVGKKTLGVHCDLF